MQVTCVEELEVKTRITALLSLALAFSAPVEATAQSKSEPPVKMSRSGICHAKGTTFYSRTKNFRPFQTMQACLDAGGRLPKR
ncbi:MAG: hypothetical protein AAFY42_05900 [Pseudomonadota bacterium]